MKKFILLLLVPLFLTSCDVHEWPVLPEFVKLHLKLDYETYMTKWEHIYDGEIVISSNKSEVYDNHREYGKIRYIVRTYAVSERQQSVQDYTQEFIFTKDIKEGYDHQVTLDIVPGNYKIMVWSDLVESDSHSHFYNATNLSKINLQGEHKCNTDYKDAFRGVGSASLVADIVERKPDTLNVKMERPLAKFEFVTNDLSEFLGKEAQQNTKTVDMDDYRVVFSYVGFMPHTYNLSTDKPVDSSTGVVFESALKKLNETEASMGFDYVFVNNNESSISIQIGIFNNEGVQLSITEPIDVPLKRSHHTIIKGKFIMAEASGGVAINPDFDGDRNLIIP